MREAAEALEDDRQTFLIKRERCEDVASDDDVANLLEVVKFNPMQEDLVDVFGALIIDLSDSAKISLTKCEESDAQLYYNTDLDQFVTF